MRKVLIPVLLSIIIFSCGRRGIGSSVGGELTGIPVGKVWEEPTPYNMVLVTRGAYRMGPAEIDSLWGFSVPSKGVSVDNFWMDEKEITNAQYKQFVYWVRDSIIRERLADPAYAGSAMHLSSPRFYTQGNSTLVTNVDSDSIRRHIPRSYNFMASYNISLFYPLDIQPMIWVQGTNATTQIRATMRAIFRQKYSGGASWVKNDGYVFFAGALIRGVEIGYAYSLHTQGIGKQGNGKNLNNQINTRNFYEQSTRKS